MPQDGLSRVRLHPVLFAELFVVVHYVLREKRCSRAPGQHTALVHIRHRLARVLSQSLARDVRRVELAFARHLFLERW